MPNRYPEIEVAGSCQAMGEQIGEAVAEHLRAFVALAWDRASRIPGVTRETISRVVTQSTLHLEKYAPDLLLELRGMSESSGVSFDDLMFLQIRNQLTAHMDSGCTSVSAGPSSVDRQHSMIGQNWDNDPALDSVTIVLTRRPADKPSFITVTQAGLIAYIGFSDAGIGACLNSLPAPSRPVGVPHYFTLRRIFECCDLESAVQSVASAYRAIPANIMLATPQGPADLEVTMERVCVLRPDSSSLLVHTNHCLHPDLEPVNQQFDELIQSHPRLDRIRSLPGVVGGGLNRELLQAAFRDHADFPQSICRHSNNHPPHGDWKTVFSVIMSPETGEMYVSRGNPCENQYELYCLR